uniref:GRAM domain-containing protein n=1 Tax=Castor canadensis TaxID=51338 RepID=A0A8C0XS41_CASCN
MNLHTDFHRGCTNVELSFPQSPQGSNLFSGTKRGTLFLTSYRVIFVTSRSASDPMLSFMMPFDLMKNCTVEQPVFGANYIKGTIQAAPDGGWEGQATFKLVFKKGGAIHFAQLMMQAATAVIVYGALPAGYGVPSRGYGTPAPGYGVPPPGYGAPLPGYGTPPPGYGAPPPGYRASPAIYGAPPPAYGAPPPGYGVPPPMYGTPPPRYEAPSPGYEDSPAGIEARPVGYGAGHSNPGTAQTSGYEATRPSTSSSQTHSPPSKM